MWKIGGNEARQKLCRGQEGTADGSRKCDEAIVEQTAPLPNALTPQRREGLKGVKQAVQTAQTPLIPKAVAVTKP